MIHAKLEFQGLLQIDTSAPDKSLVIFVQGTNQRHVLYIPKKHINNWGNLENDIISGLRTAQERAKLEIAEAKQNADPK